MERGGEESPVTGGCLSIASFSTLRNGHNYSHAHEQFGSRTVAVRPLRKTTKIGQGGEFFWVEEAGIKGTSVAMSRPNEPCDQGDCDHKGISNNSGQ